jgi:hypothetical protein
MTDHAEKTYTTATRQLGRAVYRLACRIWARYLVARANAEIRSANAEIARYQRMEQAIPRAVTIEVERIADAQICKANALAFLKR